MAWQAFGAALASQAIGDQAGGAGGGGGGGLPAGLGGATSSAESGIGASSDTFNVGGPLNLGGGRDQVDMVKWGVAGLVALVVAATAVKVARG